MLRNASGSSDRRSSASTACTSAQAGSASNTRATEATCSVDSNGETDGVGLLELRCLDAAELAGLARHGLLDVLGDIQRFVNQAAGYRARVLGALDQLGSDGRAPEVSPHMALRDATGISEREARQITRTADKTREHDAVLNSLSQGDITSAQAEALCDARVTDDTRAELLTAATQEDSDQTRRSVYEAECAEETALQRFKRQREARGAGWRRNHEGMLQLWARFDPRTGAQIEATLESLQQQYWINDKQDRSGRRSPAQRDADVLAYALAGLTNNKADEKTVERLSGGRDANSAARLPRAQVSVLIDLDALRQSTDATGFTDAGIELPSEVVRNLACDAQLIPIILGGPGGSPDVGRARRSVPLGLRRSLIARDLHCQWPGCNQPPSRCDAHHVIHWANGGPTNLDNLVLLCHRHHHQLHEHSYQMIRQPDSSWHAVPQIGRNAEPLGLKTEPCHTTKQARGP